MVKELHIYALHGFLGTPNDWQSLKKDFQKCRLNCIDLFMGCARN